MLEYTKLIADCLDVGQKQINRTETDTITYPLRSFTWDMRRGFPLLTNKMVSLRNVAVELEFFIKGLTDKSWLQERGCNIWNDWCNPQALEYEMNMSGNSDLPATQVNDLGPIYGYQWRRFGHKYYDTAYGRSDAFEPLWEDPTDQLANAIHKLRTEPNCRRMVVSAWNPPQLHQMALAPCHYSFVITHVEGDLFLEFNQRSADAFLGVPYNIASYDLLLELIAKMVGMRAVGLKGNFTNFHIYEDHIRQCEQMLSNKMHDQPRLELPEKVDIFSWTYEDFTLHNYNHSGIIKAPVAV